MCERERAADEVNCKIKLVYDISHLKGTGKLGLNGGY